MNWDQIKGNWTQVTGNVKQQWGKLTDSDMTMIAGHREQLAGKIQERYGIAKEEAEKQLDAWQAKVSEAFFKKSDDQKKH
ncbi:MAG TPA: CsbD family protein [Ramlibacter sp.]|nr:CsbD family protein [Ramlibacter sp.]